MAYLYYSAEIIPETSFIVPFFKDLIIPMSPFIFIFTGMFVLIGSSNAVNLTDGLDGLAILPSVLIGGALGLIAYAMGNQLIADYLYLPHLPLSGELNSFLWRFDRIRNWVFMVQHLSSTSFYGRYRITSFRRYSRNNCDYFKT